MSQPAPPQHAAVGGPVPEGTAPTADTMEAVQGYENVGMQGSTLPPPTFDPSQREPAPERRDFQNAPNITDEEARDALMKFISENCCYGKGAAQQLAFTDLKSTSAFHYTLETYGESRQTGWTWEPFVGQPVDGPQNGPAPGPWDIQMVPPNMFEDKKVETEVPHTASVKPCHQCAALGRVRCHHCLGDGGTSCHTCHGSGEETYYEDGHHHHRVCHHCNGTGRRRCDHCHGHGQITCKTCNGRASLKFYIKMSVIWTNHASDHIVERTPLPDELIRRVIGQIAFEETQPMVWAINHFPDAEVNTASNSLVNQHASQFTNERIIMQRQRVRIIPVTQAFYTWKESTSHFFVYGYEQKVHAPDYPQKCCWGCAIL